MPPEEVTYDLAIIRHTICQFSGLHGNSRVIHEKDVYIHCKAEQVRDIIYSYDNFS